MSELRGVIAPFTTPFNESGALDLALVKPQVDWLIENDPPGLNRASDRACSTTFPTPTTNQSPNTPSKEPRRPAA